MTLHDVQEKGQLSAYYTEKNLQTIEQKIDNLTKTMKIRATKCDEAETKEEILAGLEETALLGNWKVSW